MSQAPAPNAESDAEQLDAAADQAIAACGGFASQTVKSSESNRETRRDEPFFDLKFSRLIEITLTAALVGIAYFQYAVYERQAGIMEKQNAITISGTRAVVNLHLIDLTPGPGYYDFGFKIWNDGNTSTAGLSVIVDCVKRAAAEQEPFDLLERNSANAFRELIPPKQEATVYPKDRTRCRIPQSDLDKIVGGNEHFYFVGEALYRDTVDNKATHVTQFAKELTIDISTKGLQEPIASAFSRGQHNCSDNDCPK